MKSHLQNPLTPLSPQPFLVALALLGLCLGRFSSHSRACELAELLKVV